MEIKEILQVCPTYSPYTDGAAEYVKNLSEKLAGKYHVTVFTCDFSGKLPKEESLEGVKVKRFRCLSAMNAIHLSPSMNLEMRKGRFDIVHAHNYHALPFYFSQFIKKRRFIASPYYHASAHTPFLDFLLKIYKPLGMQVINKADSIISISYSEKAALIKDFPRISSKISLVPPGTDRQESQRTNCGERNAKNILCVARLEEYKGVQEIIQAMPFLQKEFRLSVVGKGAFKGNLVTLINNLGLQDRVSFHQDLPRSELIKMYSEAGLFILLSQFESYSIVVAEALSCGTPCIVANTSGLKEWVDQKNCFGIDHPVDSKILANMINEISGRKVDDIKLRDWDEVVQEIIEIYNC